MNKNPVPETDKTIHQVASEIDFIGEKIRLHEETLVRENEQICDLHKEIHLLKEENKSMKQFMENMFYRMESQEAMIQTLVNTVSMPMQPIFMPMPMPMQMPMMPMPGYYPIHQIPMEPNLVEKDGLEDYTEEKEDGEEREEEEYQYDSEDNDNYCESCDARLSHKGYAFCDMCHEKSEQKQRYMKTQSKGKMELSELM